MKEIDYIVGIYNYFNPLIEEGSESYFYLLYLLDEKGLLDQDISAKLFKDKFENEELPKNSSNANSIGPFVTLENLNQYAFALCEELNASQVSLFSVSEYNSILETSQQASDFHRDLLTKGNVIKNIERKKKGLLGRFFS
jgi:hypothetical protein